MTKTLIPLAMLVYIKLGKIGLFESIENRTGVEWGNSRVKGQRFTTNIFPSSSLSALSFQTF